MAGRASASQNAWRYEISRECVDSPRQRVKLADCAAEVRR